MIDDILDFTSREKILGKPVGNDLREGKVTLPLIYALETADAEERKRVETVLADGNYDQVPFAKILQILTRHGSIERARERAQFFTDKARQIISEFPESPASEGTSGRHEPGHRPGSLNSRDIAKRERQLPSRVLLR